MTKLATKVMDETQLRTVPTMKPMSYLVILNVFMLNALNSVKVKSSTLGVQNYKVKAEKLPDIGSVRVRKEAGSK
jgi:hypothetical protein